VRDKLYAAGWVIHPVSGRLVPRLEPEHRSAEEEAPACTERDLRVILATLATAVARGETDPATARRLWRAAVKAKA
jgi:hypothetical protein